MSDSDYTSRFAVEAAPATVYDAIVAVRDWWDGDIDGDADRVGGEFTYRYEQMHVSRQRVTALEPGRRVAWHVVDGSINFVADTTEWNGTDIIFDITPHGTGSDVRITHVGLVPQKQCFDGCSQGWDHYFGKSLPALINRLALPHTSKTEA